MTADLYGTAADRASCFRLTENRPLSRKVHLLRFEGNTAAITAPGQFVSLLLPGKYLRRPFSVCDWNERWLTVLVERVGAGTEELQNAVLNTEYDILTGLGNGFQLPPTETVGEEHTVLLIGGGSGLSPLVGLARLLRMEGYSVRVLLGFREDSDRFGKELFPDLEVSYTEDVFEVMQTIPHECFFACGSQSMMRSLCMLEPHSGQVAFDVRMGCGFGVCMGCSIRTRGGMKRVCRDGPVFRKEELIWEG